MRGYSVCLVLALALCCSSCETGGRQAKAIVPPVPAPAAKPAPIVVAQTVAQLPDPQPIPPESIPPRPPIEYQPPVKEAIPEPEPAQDPKTVRPPTRTTTGRTVKRDAPATPTPAEVTPPVTTATPPAEETATPPKLSAADEASVSREQLNGTLAEVQKILKDLSGRPQTASSKATITRIHSFVRLAEQSEARNDLRQGDILARRALTLARDLASPK
jgi:hypothetical protein